MPALAPLSSRDLAILEAIASVSNQDTAKISDVLAALPIENRDFQPYRKRLLDHGVIVAPRNGEVSFTVPYLADYLREKSW